MPSKVSLYDRLGYDHKDNINILGIKLDSHFATLKLVEIRIMNLPLWSPDAPRQTVLL